jgi:serine/threonine-protein kinase
MSPPPQPTTPYVPPEPPTTADDATTGVEAAAAAEGPTPQRVGRFPVVGVIGRGGMGAVWRGHDPDLRRDLAVKVLRDEHAERPEVVARFLEEAQVGGQLQHPGVVPVYEMGRDGARPYFAMKLVQGRNLAELLARRTSPADDLPRFLLIFEQIAQALAYAHAHGVVHRDLKPSNVMVGEFGEVQVMDWGLAKVLTRASLTRRPVRSWARRRTWRRSRPAAGPSMSAPTSSASAPCCARC